MEDVFKIVEPADFSAMQELMTYEDAARFVGPYAFSIEARGRLICCAGIQELWHGRGNAWAFLSVDSGPFMLALVRAARRFLLQAPFSRIEAAVDCVFEPGHKLARALGFEVETTRLRKYCPRQRDHTLYVRIK